MMVGFFAISVLVQTRMAENIMVARVLTEPWTRGMAACCRIGVHSVILSIGLITQLSNISGLRVSFARVPHIHSSSYCCGYLERVCWVLHVSVCLFCRSVGVVVGGVHYYYYYYYSPMVAHICLYMYEFICTVMCSLLACAASPSLSVFVCLNNLIQLKQK